jgi:metal-responsive CopG/Arc/MetJ family transcriptional regulator
MKTAISIPDPIFNEAESLANRLGISRSQLYAKAVAEYTKSRQSVNITETLNKVYSKQNNELDKELSSMQFDSIQKEEW